MTESPHFSTNACRQGDHPICRGVAEMKGSVEKVGEEIIDGQRHGYYRQGIIGFHLCGCPCHDGAPVDTTAEAPPGYIKTDLEFLPIPCP